MSTVHAHKIVTTAALLHMRSLKLSETSLPPPFLFSKLSPLPTISAQFVSESPVYSWLIGLVADSVRTKSAVPLFNEDVGSLLKIIGYGRQPSTCLVDVFYRFRTCPDVLILTIAQWRVYANWEARAKADRGRW
ncbi:unnamed protein product [Somion occarium]|uniref:Uncharacterized protein n=1 Tax=Somion occarium TaxID=3059160 RepID=A0ABP1CUE1_9APHY